MDIKKIYNRIFNGTIVEAELRSEIAQLKSTIVQLKFDKQDQINKTNSYWKTKIYEMQKVKTIEQMINK